MCWNQWTADLSLQSLLTGSGCGAFTVREHLIILAEALHNAALIISVFPSFNQKQTLHTAKHITDVTNGHIYVFEQFHTTILTLRQKLLENQLEEGKMGGKAIGMREMVKANTVLVETF